MSRLDSVRLPSLTPAIVAELAAYGIRSVDDVLLAESTPTLEEFGTEAQKQAIADILDYLDQQSWGFRTSARLLQESQARGVWFLPTGCESLDKLLEGGLRVGAVTELVGGSSSGKTRGLSVVPANLCAFTIKHIRVLSFLGWFHLSRYMPFFSATRLSHMLGGLVGGQDAIHRRAGAADEIGEAMKIVKHYSIFDIFSMISLLNQVHINLAVQVQGREQGMRLLIVDCASSVISPILGGTQGHALMVKMGTILKKLALENHLAVLAYKRQAAFRITRTGLKPAF